MNAMGVLIYVIIILVAIMLRILFASIMNGVAIKKGQVEACLLYTSDAADE